MKSRANDRFWRSYRVLPPEIRTLARKTYRLWCRQPDHPSLHFKKVATDTWSARIGPHYRVLAAEENGILIWFWIGSHDEYERLLRK
jgi:hypothetical protein